MKKIFFNIEKWSLVSYVHISFQRTEKKTSHCSMGTRSQSASSAGKFETLGSNFSNETRICEAACVLILQFSEVFFFYAFMSFPRTEKRLLNCSMSTRSQPASSAGKFET